MEKYKYIPKTENTSEPVPEKVVELEFRNNGDVWLVVSGYVLFVIETSGDCKVISNGPRCTGLTLKEN